MQSTLTLQEEELARSLKAQGRSTQDIMGAIAKQRTGGIDKAQTQAKEQGFSALFNVDAAKDVFNRAGQDVNLAADAGFGKFATTAVLQGGTAPFRAVGEGIFGTEKAQQATSAAVDGLTKFGDVITPEVVQDKVGSLALEAIAGYEQMNPQKQLTQRNKLAVAEVLSSFLGGATAKDTLIKPTLKGIEDTVQTATNDIADITSGIARPEVSAPIKTPLPPEVKATIVKGFDVAIKPNLSSKQTPVQLGRYNEQVARSIDTITNNRANLSYVDDATGETVTGRLPENLKEYVDALEQTKQTIFQQYDDIAAKAGEVGAQVDTVAVANQLDEILNSKSLKLSNPEAIRYAEEVRGRLLSTRNLSTVDAQDVIRNYNKSLEAFYRNPTPEGLTRNAVDAMVANNLRKALDDEIAGITGAQYQALKSDYASLKAVERDIMRAFNRDARRNTKGLIDFTDVLTGGQVVSGILSMNPAIIGQGLAGKAVSTAIKIVNDPNRKVKQIFQEAGRYQRPDAGANAPTRRQLPAAQPNAPRSEVSGGRPVEVGGQTERGQVTTGITERTREGAVRQPEGERVATEVEQAVKQDNDAVAQAVSEMEAELSGQTRPSVGENFVQTADGSAYRFNELPSWVPDGLRDADLMERVMINITTNKKPKSNSGLEIELQQVTEARIKTRIAEIKEGQGGLGVFSGDTAFAVALMVGGTYFLAGEDGSILPMVAIGSMMANPVTRKAAIKSMDKVAEQVTKRDVTDDIVLENLMRLDNMDVDPIDTIRLDQLKKTADRRPLNDNEMLEARAIVENNEGPLPKAELGKAKSATTQTNLLEEAKKYKTADEFTQSIVKEPLDPGIDRKNLSSAFRIPNTNQYVIAKKTGKSQDETTEIVNSEGEKISSRVDKVPELEYRIVNFDNNIDSNLYNAFLRTKEKTNSLETIKSQLTDIWKQANK